MPDISYLFTTPGNYTFDPVKIEVTGGVAQLKLVIAGGQVFNEDFTDDTGFTYNNTQAEFLGGLVRQKDITPTNSLFAVSYLTDASPITSEADLNWHKAGGSISAVLNGAPTIVSGKLVCPGVHGVYYTRNSSVIETHKFKFTPSYSTTPAANINLVTTWNGSNNDKFLITHSPSGNTLRLTLYDDIGTLIILVATIVGPPWEPTAGVEYEFEVVLDSVAGIIYVFIDGVLHGTNSPGAWTRGTGAMRYYMGASPGLYNITEGSFDDYIMFNDVQHTIGYTPGYTIDPTLYVESEVELPVFTHIGLGTILSLDGLVTSEVGSPRYSFEAGTLGHVYWNGSDWVASDGSYAQANDVATANTNLPSLTAISGEITFHVHTHFTDTNTQSSVDDLTVDHTANTVYDLTNPTITPNVSMSLDAISAFVATLVEPGSDAIQFCLQLDGQDTYWDGAAWSNADGTYAQSNDLATVQANLGAWTGRGVVFVKIFLHSNDGGTTPQIDILTITFDFFGGPSTALNINTVWGFLFDSEDNPIEGVKVHITPLIYGTINEKILTTRKLVVTTDATGYWEAKLVETDSITDPAFGYLFRFADQRVQDLTGRKYVPDLESSNYNTLANVP